MNVSLPFEGHKVAYQCKGLDQSNIVCAYEVNLSTNDSAYEVNLSTNDKGYSWKTKLTQIVKEQCWISRSSEATCWWKGLDLSNIVC